jgi:hypothetical protein
MATGAPLAGMQGQRAGETRQLDEALDQLSSGRQKITLAAGEAGTGKTRLLAETLDRARGRDYDVALGWAERIRDGGSSSAMLVGSQ